MMAKKDSITLIIAQDILDHLEVYNEKIRDEVASMVYIVTKKSLGDKKKKEEVRLKNGTI